VATLFNPKTIARHIGAPPPIPADHLDILKDWSDLIESGRILEATI